MLIWSILMLRIKIRTDLKSELKGLHEIGKPRNAQNKKGNNIAGHPVYNIKIARRTTGAQGNSFLTSCSMSQKTKFTYKYMFLLISITCDIY